MSFEHPTEGEVAGAAVRLKLEASR